MSQVAVIARIPVQPGKRDDAIAAMQIMLDHVHNEPGTLTYILHTDDNDPDTVWFYETYTDHAALAAHGGSDTMKALGGALAGVLAGRPELTFLTPVAGKGL